MQKAVRARWNLLAAAALFSTGGAAIKACSFSGWQVAGLRSLVAAAALFLLVPASRRNWSGATWLVGFAYAGTLILFVTATKLTTSANAIFLQSTAPLYLLLIGPLLLRESIRRSDLFVLAAIAAGLGMFFVEVEPALRTAPNPQLGNWLAIGSGLTWALTLAGLRWLGSKSRSGESSDLPAVLAGNLIAALICIPMGLPFPSSGVADWALIGFLGIFQIGLAYFLLSKGLRQVTAFEASLLLLAEPALNPIWAWLAHGETPGTWALGGGSLILASTVFKTWIDSRRVAAAQPQKDPA